MPLLGLLRFLWFKIKNLPPNVSSHLILFSSSLIVDRFRNLKTLLQHLIKMPSSTIVAKKHCTDLSETGEVTYSVTTSTSGPAFLKFVKISDKAQAPSKGSPLAAGYDLYSAADIVRF